MSEKPTLRLIHNVVHDIYGDSGVYSKYWLHRKTENTYEIVTFGYNEKDMEPCVVYRQTSGLKHTFIRPAKEFFDGRFIRLKIPKD